MDGGVLKETAIKLSVVRFARVRLDPPLTAIHPVIQTNSSFLFALSNPMDNVSLGLAKQYLLNKLSCSTAVAPS